jgi:hypothetical protein
MPTFKLILIALSLSASSAPAIAQNLAPSCLHGSDETPANRARRLQAVQYVARVNAAEGTSAPRLQKYRPLNELANLPPLPAGQSYDPDKLYFRYKLEDGQEYKSPSSAGSAVMGGNACNGWRFWSLAGENGETPTTKRTAKPKKAAGFKRMDDGRFWCSACMDAFEAPAGVTPIGCPQGHEPEG